MSECWDSAINQDYPICSVMVHVDKPVAGHKTMDSAMNRNAMRNMALHSDADNFLLLDSDTVLPLDAVSRLISHNLDIVGGWYPFLNRPGMWVMAKRVGNCYNNFNYPVPGLSEVDTIGLGCMLISRKVYQTIEFNAGLLPGDEIEVNGLPGLRGISARWAHDAQKAGFKLFADGGVICKHLPR